MVDGDLHHLLLVGDDTEGLFQDRLGLGQDVLHLLPAQLALDELLHHPDRERARAVEGVERRQLLEPRRLGAPQHVAHAARLELEDAVRASVAEQPEDLRVVERNRVEIEVDALHLERAQGVVDDRDGLQAEEVHLEQAETLDRLHVPLRRDFVAAGLVERHELVDRHRRDDHAGGVHRSVAGQALEAAADIDDLPDLRDPWRPRLRGCRPNAPPLPATWSCPGASSPPGPSSRTAGRAPARRRAARPWRRACRR